MDLHIDFNVGIGEIRALNGVNLAPKLHNQKNRNMNGPPQKIGRRDSRVRAAASGSDLPQTADTTAIPATPVS